MKKIATLAMAIMMSLATSVSFAEGFSTLKFTSDTGEIYTVSTDNLELIIDGSNLTFNNTDLTIPLASLVSMEFTGHYDEPSGIETAVSEIDGAVTVFGIDGTLLNSFDSCAQALGSLGRGIYVIKGSNGKTLKVKVGK